MTQSLPPVPRAVLVWLIITACIGVMLLAIVTNVFAGHLNPGCENQELKPRLVGCCPRYLAQEDLPPQCLKWEASGHLAQCCGGKTEPSPVPTPASTATPCFNGYDFVPCPEQTGCAAPTPLPTPVEHAKGACCREVRSIYATARRDIVRREKAELKALVAWKLDAMRECREAY